jgi:hypothetical protein
MAQFNVSGRLNSDDLYPCRDRPVGHEHVIPTWSIAAMWLVEDPRPPKKGEWYLSGKPLEARRAHEDMTEYHYLCRLVRVERVVSYEPKPFDESAS